jgi:hypothetical protein
LGVRRSARGGAGGHAHDAAETPDVDPLVVSAALAEVVERVGAAGRVEPPDLGRPIVVRADDRAPLGSRRVGPRAKAEVCELHVAQRTRARQQEILGLRLPSSSIFRLVVVRATGSSSDAPSSTANDDATDAASATSGTR